MNKKRKIDFILYENDDQMIVFRFLPRQSGCHSFNDNPPTKWEEVYKVYYSYKIFRRWKDDNFSELLFNSNCDECSVIDEIAARIKYIVAGEKSITMNYMNEEYTIELLNNEVRSIGYGVSWIINGLRESNLYEISLWNHDEIGYRFCLEKDKLAEFGEYLNECCEYMLAHGDPI